MMVVDRMISLQQCVRLQVTCIKNQPCAACGEFEATHRIDATGFFWTKAQLVCRDCLVKFEQNRIKV